MSGRSPDVEDDPLDGIVGGGDAGAGRAPEPEAAAVAGWLGALQASGAAPPGAEVALLLGQAGQLYVHAAAPDPADLLGAAAGLVIGLAEHAGPGARWAARRRLWSTRDAPLDRAAAQVGARRGRFGLRPGPLTQPLPPVVDLGPALARARARGRLLSPPPGPPLARAWAAVGGRSAGAPAGAPRWALDRPVGAALVDGAARALGVARNQAAEHRLLHAEVVLLLGVLAERGAPLPPGCRLYTTLQPCRLCAALIVEAGVSEVIFDEPDPGRFGQATALQAAGIERRARSDEGGRSEPG